MSLFCSPTARHPGIFRNLGTPGTPGTAGCVVPGPLSTDSGQSASLPALHLQGAL